MIRKAPSDRGVAPRGPAGGGAVRPGYALATAAVFAAGAVLAALPAGATALTTSGLTRVSVSSFQALPPPYKPPHAVLTSAASLRRFEGAVRADHIGVASHPTSVNGCAGGTNYTVTLTYTKGRRTSLDAYDCGRSVTGNMTGSVQKFVSYLAALL